MNYFSVLLTILLLGFVEGFTEFLPVSSTGHLIIIGEFIESSLEVFKNGMFDVFIQAGAVLAVLVLYREKVFTILKNPFSGQSLKVSSNIVIATLPIVILGIIFYDFIMDILFKNINLIAIMLILGGFVILWIEKKDIKFKTDSMWDISWKQALGVGLFQILALIPGTSRSGATIIGGLLCGLSRKTSAEFSFFVAIPVILGASFFDIIKNFSHITTETFLILFLGFVVSFISSLIFIKWFIDFISNKTFKVFGYYRILLGLFILMVYYIF